MAEERAKIPQHILMILWMIENNSQNSIDSMKKFAPNTWADWMRDLREFERVTVQGKLF